MRGGLPVPFTSHLHILLGALYAVGGFRIHRAFFGQESDPGMQIGQHGAGFVVFITEITAQVQFRPAFI